MQFNEYLMSNVLYDDDDDNDDDDDDNDYDDDHPRNIWSAAELISV